MTPVVAPVVAIDGPAASGKGTLARRLAAELGLPHLDTGLLYRAVACRVRDRGAGPEDARAAAAEACALETADLGRPDLRTPDIAAASSIVARQPAVRAALLAFQRAFARERGAVLDGRDIGTVVFPHAPAKLFVTADLPTRARRRWAEEGGALADVLRRLAARDAQDAARATAPMRPADDATLLDTTGLDPDAAFTRALAIVRARLDARQRETESD